MRDVVISLGGSLIASEAIDYSFIKKLRKTIISKRKNWRFTIVCGGGQTARKYISVLSKDKKSEKDQSLVGIGATCLNAEFMMELFEPYANSKIPRSMKETSKMLKKHNPVFCCAFRYIPHRTSDSTAADLAGYLKCPMINLSNIDYLYDKNPKEFKSAKKIESISWKDFNNMTKKIKFKAGQNFVLDQNASKTIMKNKTKTYLLGSDMKNLSRLLDGKRFKGTTIS